MRLHLGCWLLALLLLCAGRVAAHPTPESQVWIDSRADGLTLTLRLPLSRLEFAFGQALAEKPAQVLDQHGPELSRYLLAHIGIRSGGQGWRLAAPSLRVIGADSTAELEATLQATAPPGADARHFDLSYDVITHEVRTHRVTVYLRNDWKAGRVAQTPRPLGELNTGLAQLRVALGDTEAGAALKSLFLLGMGHIATGADHLLFLFCLLLVAPLLARQGQWTGVRPTRSALAQLAAVITSFTVGHSLTLLLGSVAGAAWAIPGVEFAVALTILLAAMHAWRPLRQRGELGLAAACGLIHGLAFSSGLATGGLSPGEHALALLTFNLGIEAMQLMLVLAVMPPLLVLASQTPKAYAALRRLAALFCGGAALAWAIERGLPSAPSLIPTSLSWEPTQAALACLTLWLVAATQLPWRAVSRTLCARD